VPVGNRKYDAIQILSTNFSRYVDRFLGIFSTAFTLIPEHPTLRWINNPPVEKYRVIVRN